MMFMFQIAVVSMQEWSRDCVHSMVATDEYLADMTVPKVTQIMYMVRRALEKRTCTDLNAPG